MTQLSFEKVKAFAMISDDDERSSSIKGYYKDENIALIDAKGAGWYGSDGKVESVDVLVDDKGNIFEFNSLGKFKDVNRKYREEAVAKIKEKLTIAEQKLLGMI